MGGGGRQLLMCRQADASSHLTVSTSHGVCSNGIGICCHYPIRVVAWRNAFLHCLQFIWGRFLWRVSVVHGGVTASVCDSWVRWRLPILGGSMESSHLSAASHDTCHLQNWHWTTPPPPRLVGWWHGYMPCTPHRATAGVCLWSNC
jgi:hypothetical protein